MTQTALAPHAPSLDSEITLLAQRWKRLNGPLISALNRLGGKLELQLAMMPKTLRSAIEAVTAQGLTTAYQIAGQGGKLPDTKGHGPMAAAMVAGAAGGAGGLPSAVAELPFTITVLMHAIRREAARAGFDPDDPWIRAECLRCFGSGGPLAADDGIDTSFLSARLTLTGPALQGLISKIAPKLATSLGQKLAAQAVPILGAVSGAALNAAFLRYYRETAAIRFALLKLAESHGADPVLEAFAKATGQPLVKKA